MNWPDLDFRALTPAVVLMAGIFLSLQLERLVKPVCPGWKRPLASTALHAGLFLGAWAALMLVCRRPIFSALVLLAGQLLVVQISNAKFRALREPFIFSDFGIFSQAVKHPRLYLPFLGLWRALLAGIALVVAVGFGLMLEHQASQFLAWGAAAACLGLLFSLIGWGASATPCLNPEQDLAERGLFASVAQYWLREQTIRPLRQTRLPAIRKREIELPDVIVIQSESFFDARRLFAGIRSNVLENYDVACAESAMHGRLRVSAWGANTMRPEFSFLTGLAPESLDIHRFNPYRRIAQRPVRALPTAMSEAGYRTTCIHPHPARFFRRDRAFPNLGFDRFIDIREFRGAAEAGPYISDKAVTDKLLGELERAQEPAFFFVITMENHGPLHLEQVNPGDAEQLYTEPPPPGCEDLTVYLRHLRNADKELGRLRDFLATRRRPSLLCFYGEHLPSMPKVYDELGLPDGQTDYLLQVSSTNDRVVSDVAAEDLPYQILRFLGS